MLIRLVEQDAEDELGSMSGSDADDGEDTGLHDEEDNYMEHHQLEDMFQEVLKEDVNLPRRDDEHDSA